MNMPMERVALLLKSLRPATPVLVILLGTAGYFRLGLPSLNCYAADAQASAASGNSESGDSDDSSSDDEDYDDSATDSKATASVDHTSDDNNDNEDDDDVTDPKTIAGNVNLATDYILRGLSQTDHQPALQGGFDWNHPLGFYLGVWGSNVHFPGADPSLEIDWFGGYTYQLNDDWNVSLGVLYYTYFMDDGRNSFDVPLKTEWKAFSLEIDYSPHWQGDSDSWYFLAGWEDEVIWGFKLGAYAGYSVFPADSEEPSYPDFRVSVAHDFMDLEWGLAGVFVRRQVVDDAVADSRAIFSVSKAF